jgi:hypothetical protein
VSFQTDFEGEYSDRTITGVIYWCSTRAVAGRSFTTGIGSGSVSLEASADGMTLSGHFVGANGTESISFTRVR